VARAGGPLPLALVLVLMPGALPAAEPADPVSGDLLVFHAGSLSVPFAQIAAAFEQAHPSVRVLREAAGSRACARKIADLGRPCDVFGSADYTVINTLLIPEHAAWCIQFASNEMVVAYTESSRGADRVGPDTWRRILLEPDVAFGRSDPNADPCGYRAVLTVKLAEKHYKEPGLAEALLGKDRRYIRPKETDLLALLEAGAIDYVFIYRSVSEQHKLRYVTLPDEVNLRARRLAKWYGTATVEISGKKPGEVVVKQGEPMVYGVTIPKRAPNPAAALAFVAFLLEEDTGLAIMRKNGQPSLVPAPSATYVQIPPALRRFAREARQP